MSTLSEGELHVQAMRLVCEALADREKTGLEVDWDVINHMHDHMDVIFRGIEDQRRDDQDELMHTRKDRDAAHEQICTLRDQMKAEIETLRTELVDSRVANINLQGQLDAARAETVETRKRLNEETDRHRATNAEKIELFQQKESANKHNAELQGKLDAAQAAVALQRAGIERLQAFVNLSRRLLGVNMNYADVDRLRAGLAELDAGTEPTPVAEPLDAEGGA